MALEKTINALKEQRFGVFTEIKLKSIFKKRLDIDFDKNIIIGPYYFPFAHKGRDYNHEIGLLLPSNLYI